MPCESCAVQFSVFKRKRACCECDRYYCSGCLRRGGGMCAPCRVLSARPSRDTIASLKVRDLQCFLQRQNVSTRGCVEKDELVRLCESHVNSTSYRRRGQRPGASPFSSFKGFTNNINDFINSAFDLRTTPAAQQQQAQQPPSSERGYSTGGCFNSAHAHGAEAPARPAAPTTSPPRRDPERFTTRPCGEPDIVIPVPDLSSSVSRSTSGETTRVDTADCFEVEDLDDAGWEFVNRPADPLPNDSAEILMTVTTEGGSRRTQSVPLPGTGAHVPRTDTHVERTDSDMGRTDTHVGRTDTDVGRTDTRAPDTDTLGVRSAPARASSELNLGPAAHDDAADNTDSASLQDEPISQHHTSTPKHISVEQFLDVSELSALSVKQLKELLTRHRVEYRGALERADLLHRATTLWHNHHKYSDDIENMPIEECCKICMAAPLECVLLECGHIAACTACSKQLAECPICRQYVVRAVRFFRS